LSPTDVMALLGGGLDPESVGPLAGRPLLAIALPADQGTLTEILDLPCVLVGVHREGPRPDPPVELDVLLTSDRGAPPPWIDDPEGDVLAALEAAVRSSATAAVTLVQLLRLTGSTRIRDALVGESLAYAALQSGPDYARWLAAQPDRSRGGDDGEPVLVTRDGASLTLTLNRPAVRNAFSAAMRDGLVDALRVAVADPDITDVHLRGAGPAFCSGGDLREFGTVPDPMSGHLVRTSRSPAAWLARPQVQVTAHLHGACRGAGVELAAFAHRVVATADATLGLPEIAMGLVPGAGGTVSIPRRIARQRAAYLALSGAVIDAATALDWGLVDEVVS
jgi:hypothetical protein